MTSSSAVSHRQPSAVSAMLLLLDGTATGTTEHRLLSASAWRQPSRKRIHLRGGPLAGDVEVGPLASHRRGA